VSRARTVGSSVHNAFGVPETGQLGPVGKIQRRYWNHGLQARIVAWAEANNITVTEDPIEQ
jgi:hypothetical protein